VLPLLPRSDSLWGPMNRPSNGSFLNVKRPELATYLAPVTSLEWAIPTGYLCTFISWCLGTEGILPFNEDNGDNKL
jgi:hypothetical protein